MSTINLDSSFEEQMMHMFNNYLKKAVDETIKKYSEPKKYFSVKDACAYLGISHPTFRKLEHEKMPPTMTIGNKKMFSKEALDKMMKSLEH